MRLISSDGKKSVNIGGSDIWYSIYSTAVTTFGRKKKDIALALEFIEKGKCDGKDGYEIARQFNLIRDEFAKISPDKLVYDINNKGKKAPWTGKLSPVITSCANLYTTADGFDLFFEVVGILSYAKIAKVDITAE